MKISTLTMAFKYVFGGIGSVVDYLLDILNNALNSLDPNDQKKIQAVSNIALKIASVLKTLQFLIPTKWQNAYDSIIVAVERVFVALEDLKVENAELSEIQDSFKEAVIAWKGDDDETCVDSYALED